VNTAYFANIIEIINASNSCSDVAAALAQATTAVSTLQTAITTQLALLAPLIVAPTNLAELVTWASAMVETYVGPNATLLAQQTIIAAQLSDIAAAAAARSSTLGCM
jgi:hypothetical protein